MFQCDDLTYAALSNTYVNGCSVHERAHMCTDYGVFFVHTMVRKAVLSCFAA